MIYHKIEGDNLYHKWHLLSEAERKSIIKQICSILKKINNIPYKEFAKKFGISENINWHDEIYSRIKKQLKKIENEEALSNQFLNRIKKFIENNHNVLFQQKIALPYWDIHFDNFLISDKKVVGIIDFERVEIISIDYVLGLLKKMQDYPKIYISEDFEHLVKKEDYSNLLKWYKEFYPEIFNFEDLDKRIDFYVLEMDLKLVLDWPKAKVLRGRISKIVD